MNYVLCNAYQELFFALHLKESGEDITVVTYNKDIKKYCIAAHIACLDFETIRFSFGLTVRPVLLARQAARTLREVSTLKRRLDDVLKKINLKEGDSFYFLSKEVCYEGFYLAKELSKRGKGTVNFVDILWRESIIYRARFNRRFLDHLIVRYLLRLFWGLKLMSYETSGYPRFGIDDRFFKENKIAINAPDRAFEELLLDVVKKTKTELKQYDNLLIGESSVIIGIISYDSIKEVYRNLAGLSVEIVLKKHPNWREEKTQIDVLYEEFFRDWEELPEYIPVELSFNNIRKSVIGTVSAALITASQLEHLKAISLLELVEWYNQAYKNMVKNDLIKKSKNKIIFVRDLAELKQILTGSEVLN